LYKPTPCPPPGQNGVHSAHSFSKTSFANGVPWKKPLSTWLCNTPHSLPLIRSPLSWYVHSTLFVGLSYALVVTVIICHSIGMYFDHFLLILDLSHAIFVLAVALLLLLPTGLRPLSNTGRCLCFTILALMRVSLLYCTRNRACIIDNINKMHFNY